MGKIISAKDYGYRKVIRAVVNPDDSEWVHADGSDSPSDHTGNTADPDKSKTVCHDCTRNWVIREFVFEGADLNKTDAQLQEVVTAEIAAPPAAKDISSLIDVKL
jgi:hypothetical protein|tara:strand:- start:330 stop:644 length:315 start_codon:yes stop_codon:yes gene_type:complete